MIEVLPSDLGNFLGSKIVLSFNGGTQEIKIEKVDGNRFAVSLKDGICVWYSIPPEAEVKFYVQNKN